MNIVAAQCSASLEPTATSLSMATEKSASLSWKPKSPLQFLQENEGLFTHMIASGKWD
jgi:hypothetical protein